MRKIFAILLLFCYLIPAIGLSVSVHYCGGRLASFSIIGTDEAKCPCGDMPMKKDCCKDKTASFKIKDTQRNSKQIIVIVYKGFKQLPIASTPLYGINYTSIFSEQEIQFDHPPPLLNEQAIYLLNQVFLI
ncbi:MAG: hypothetical protein SGJ10_13100 [Bacteroidota bacterium]|nr:hypothetical protein [Bacteroidota bacterium]